MNLTIRLSVFTLKLQSVCYWLLLIFTLKFLEKTSIVQLYYMNNLKI